MHAGNIVGGFHAEPAAWPERLSRERLVSIVAQSRSSSNMWVQQTPSARTRKSAASLCSCRPVMANADMAMALSLWRVNSGRHQASSDWPADSFVYAQPLEVVGMSFLSFTAFSWMPTYCTSDLRPPGAHCGRKAKIFPA